MWDNSGEESGIFFLLLFIFAAIALSIQQGMNTVPWGEQGLFPGCTRMCWWSPVCYLCSLWHTEHGVGLLISRKVFVLAWIRIWSPQASGACNQVPALGLLWPLWRVEYWDWEVSPGQEEARHSCSPLIAAFITQSFSQAQLGISRPWLQPWCVWFWELGQLTTLQVQGQHFRLWSWGSASSWSSWAGSVKTALEIVFPPGVCLVFKSHHFLNCRVFQAPFLMLVGTFR